jgi:hypothetical protein
MKEETTDRFMAYAEDGTRYRVTEFTEIVDTSTVEKRRSARGLKRYELEDSRALNPVGKDGKTFEIFDTKEKLTRR